MNAEVKSSAAMQMPPIFPTDLPTRLKGVICHELTPRFAPGAFLGAATLLGLMVLTVMPGWAAVKHWQGDVNGNWNTAGNWLENAVPVNGDELNFSAATRYTITNNIAGLRLDRIVFTGGGYLVRAREWR